MGPSAEIEFRFRLGEAFPSNSMLARWLTGLSIILNDLVFETSMLSAVRNDRRAAAEHTYFFRLSAAHFREAAHFMWKWGSEQEVKEFIASLSDETRNRFDEFRASYQPWQGSFVEQVIVPLRNNVVFHYPEPVDDGITNALAKLRDRESGIHAITDSLGDMRCEFADEVANLLAFDSFDPTNMEQLRAYVGQLGKHVANLIAFAHDALTRYLAILVKEGRARKLP